MPPKKIGASTAAAKAKAKIIKKNEDTVEIENSELLEEVPEKKTRGKPLQKKADIENAKEETTKVVDKKPKALKAKPAAKKMVEDEEFENVEDLDEVQEKKAKGTRGRAIVKKNKAEEEMEDTSETEIPEKKPKASKAKAAPKNKVKKETAEEVETAEENKTVTRRKLKPVAEEGTKPKGKAATSKAKAKSSKQEIGNDETENPDKKPATAKKTARGKAKSEEVEELLVMGRKRTAVNKSEDSGPVVKKPANNSLTVWEEIEFGCTTKNSENELPNFHITSWNVDGMRAWLKKGGLDILKHDNPDILCLQEIKCSNDKIPEEMKNVEGYEDYWCGSEKEGYAGVAILTKQKPINVIYGIDNEEHDQEGRCITAEYSDFYLVNVYVPNAGRKLVTLPKRLDWNQAFKDFIKNLDAKKPVIICGDMNVAHSEIDLANPKTNTKNAGFTVEEREGMTDFLNEGFVDTFRKLYPELEKAYTFWTYMSNARAKNVGWRLDYFIVSDRFTKCVCDNIIRDKVFGSDHCPISLYVKL